MKIAKRIALILFFLLFLVITSGVIIAYVYQDRVKKYLVTEISKNLTAETGVSEIEFSVLRKFPMASLSFRQIWCKSTGEGMAYDTLFQAERLFLQFHVLDIFSNNYSIKRVDLENAKVNIEFNKYGRDNFHFWKEVASEDSSSGQALSIDLDKMIFDNTHFNYVDAKRSQKFAFQARHMEAGGSLMENTGSLSISYDVLCEMLIVNKKNFLNNKVLTGSVDLIVDSAAYEIKRGKIGIDGLKVKVDGFIDKELENSSTQELSLRFNGSKLDIPKTLSLLPANDLMDPYTVKGKADLIVAINGNLKSKQALNVRIDYKTKGASLKIDTFGLSFTHIEMDGVYHSNYTQEIDGSKRNDKQYVEAYSFSSQIGFDEFKGSFKLWDFGNTKIDLKLRGEADLQNLKESNVPLLDSMYVVEGQVKIDVSTKGLLKAYTDHQRNYIKNVVINGFIEVENLKLHKDKESLPIYVDEGRIVVKDNDLLVKNLSLEVESSDLVLDGYFQNAIPFLLIEEQDLFVEAKLTSDLIDLNELLIDYSSTSSDTIYELEFPNQFDFNLTTDIKQLVFRRFDARDIVGNVKLKDKKLIARNLDFNTVEGSVSLNGLIDGSGDKLLASCDVKVNDIDITKLFYTFENFGQDFIKASQIKGKGTADLQFVSVWNKDLTIIQDKIYTKADITIVQGELIDIRSLLALSDYIEVSELEHVRFSTLKNQIIIKNRNVHIPKMEIASSALDITLSGNHSFDHDIDYKFKIYLPELLGKKSKKAKKENQEFGVIEDDGLGMWLFLSMTGTVNDPVIKYDKKRYVQKIGEDLKKEKQTLKTILNEEFGWFKKDTTIIKNKKKDNQEKKKEQFDDNYFIIEWDEEGEGLEEEEDDDDF